MNVTPFCVNPGECDGLLQSAISNRNGHHKLKNKNKISRLPVRSKLPGLVYHFESSIIAALLLDISNASKRSFLNTLLIVFYCAVLVVLSFLTFVWSQIANKIKDSRAFFCAGTRSDPLFSQRRGCKLSTNPKRAASTHLHMSGIETNQRNINA